MQRATHSSQKFVRRRSQRGVALITTMLLLLLLIGFSVAMTMSAGSDMFINSHYRNFRGSFYAADSGLNIVRQDMVAQIMAAVPANFNANVQPIPPGTETTVLNNINSMYGGTSFRQLASSGLAPDAWPEAYRIDPKQTQLVFAGCFADSDTTKNQPCNAPVGIVQQYTYTYNYAVTALGQSKGSENASLTDQGQLVLIAKIIPAVANINFAGYGMFIDKFDICSGTLVPGLITGPVFTNGAWTFGNNGSYTFTDPVGSVSTQAGYNFGGGTCDQVAATSDTSKTGKTIAPTFQAGFTMGAQHIPLPKDSYNQERAVIDSIGTAGQPSSTDLNTSLKDVNGNPYPASGAPASGVFLPYAPAKDALGNAVLDPVTKQPVLNFTGGGILVQGDAKVTLSAVGTSQVYQINQNGVVTTITVTPTPGGAPGAGTTLIQSGNTTTTVTGVPVIRDPASGVPTGDATMLYVNGNISSLSGTAEGAPAIQDGSQVTITAAANITVTGDILYKSQPIDMPGDTINQTGDTRQALGIFTANGDVQLNNQQADKTLTINASIATLREGGSGGIINTGAAIDTLTIVGGRIQNNIKNINTTTRNVLFDRRYANGNFAPPWFPSTPVNLGNIAPGTVKPVIFRREWANTTVYNQ